MSLRVHSIGNELIEPIVQISLVLCTIVYIMTSFFGFILFGDATMGDILQNFDFDLGVPFSVELNHIVRVSYALHLMLVFPLVFYALRLNTDGLFSDHPMAKNQIRRLIWSYQSNESCESFMVTHWNVYVRSALDVTFQKILKTLPSNSKK
ncbi:hypothetical protein L2E82_02000 [Cichorium intybus]|uniref:Uncharacterized protein n=1 Tax=Cichorium intybus TaxID=13427 RepID=A0ACB9H0F7_CICIN|nr:hypothetical protein L2E82_02000 [Cichorium intybus]